MFIENQQLHNSVDNLSDKSYWNKMSTKQAGSLYTCHKSENCWGVLAEGETKIQCQSAPQIVHT